MLLQLNERIKESMLLKFKTIKDFSDGTNIAYPSMREYLLGKKKPGYDALVSIIKATGVSAEWLMTGSEDTSNSNKTSLDMEKLSKSIEIIEKLIIKMNVRVPAHKKAMIISRVYNAAINDQVMDKNTIIGMIELAAA